MYKTKYLLVFTSAFFTFFSFSQTNDLNDIQYGFAMKATIDLNLQYPNFNVSAVGGVGGHLFDLENVYPSLHGGLLLYNHGELISTYNKSFFGSTVLDVILDFTMNFGLYRDNINFSSRSVPLYHFADFTPNPLQNPFQYSLSIGTNLIISTDDYRRQEDWSQRIGFTNVMVDRHFQLSIINDGSIWRKLGLADGLDRFYTGGGVLSYHTDVNKRFDSFEISFYKFTGHEKYAFDTATLLQLDFIPFKNAETYYYNKNRYRLTLGNSDGGYGIHATFHNADRDIQDFIHLKGNYAYHLDQFNDNGGWTNEIMRIGLGGFYQNINSQFSN